MTKLLLSTDKRLLLTNTAMTCTLLGISDALQQWISGNYDPNQDKQFNAMRTKRFATMGLIMGPMCHFWYRWLEKSTIHGSKVTIVGKKIIYDISVAPIFGSVFITGLALLEGNSIIDAVTEYRRKFSRLFRLDICVWPPTQLINFWFLPLKFRVIYVNFIQLFYNCCISYIKHNEVDDFGKSTNQSES